MLASFKPTQSNSSSCSSLRNRYVREAKKLKSTGGGLGRNGSDDGSDNESTEVYMEFYIPPSGPDDSTDEKAKNLWGE